MTLVAASVATVGAYLLFMHMASALIAVENDVDVTVRALPQMASVSAPEPASIPDGGASFEKRFSSGVPIRSSVTASQSGTESILKRAAIETGLRSPTIQTSRGSNVSGGIAYLDQALRFDPEFLAPAYVDHSTIFYRLRRFDHTFAGVLGASQTAKPSRVKPPTKLIGNPRRDHARPRVR
jgi:hypothetical protein